MRIAMLVACALALGAGAYLLAHQQAKSDPQELNTPRLPDKSAQPMLQSRGVNALEGMGLRLSEVTAYLTGPSPEAKMRILTKLLDSNVRVPQLLGPLELIASDASEDSLLRSIAMVVLMRTKGTVEHVRFIADLSARHPLGKFETVLVQFLPSTGGMICRAARQLLSGDASDDPNRAETEALLSLGLGNPDAAIARLRAELQSTSLPTLAWATDLALGLRPVPAEVSTALDRLLAGTDSRDIGRVLTALRTAQADYRESGPLIAGVLVKSMARAHPDHLVLFLDSLGAVGDASPPVIRALVDAVKRSETADASLRALTRLGTRARQATSELLLIATQVPAASVDGFHRALLALRSHEAIPYLQQTLRISTGPGARLLFGELHLVDGAEILLPEVTKFAEGADLETAGLAVQTLARLDKQLQHRDSERAIRALLRSDDPAAVRGALKALGHLDSISVDLVDTTMPLLEIPARETREEAVRQVRAMGRLRTGNGAIRDRLLREYGRVPQSPEAGGAILESLAQMAPQSPFVRAHLRDALRIEQPLLIREGALGGFVHVDDPTKEEYLLVAAQCHHGGLFGLAMRVLLRPPWEAERARNGIRTTFAQR